MTPESIVNAFITGTNEAKESIGKGKVFVGAFGIADRAGYKKDTPEWAACVHAAIAVFKGRTIIVDNAGVQV